MAPQMAMPPQMMYGQMPYGMVPQQGFRPGMHPGTAYMMGPPPRVGFPQGGFVPGGYVRAGHRPTARMPPATRGRSAHWPRRAPRPSQPPACRTR